MVSYNGIKCKIMDKRKSNFYVLERKNNSNLIVSKDFLRLLIGKKEYYNTLKNIFISQYTKYCGFHYDTNLNKTFEKYHLSEYGYAGLTRWCKFDHFTTKALNEMIDGKNPKHLENEKHRIKYILLDNGVSNVYNYADYERIKQEKNEVQTAAI